MKTFTTVEPEPCLTCGACCATFRVSFYGGEADVLGIPDHRLEQLTPVYACMSGTNQAKPRCNALAGNIGEKVACQMYEQRPSPCHELQAGDEKCQQARQRHGLPPLELAVNPEPNPLPEPVFQSILTQNILPTSIF